MATPPNLLILPLCILRSQTESYKLYLSEIQIRNGIKRTDIKKHETAQKNNW